MSGKGKGNPTAVTSLPATPVKLLVFWDNISRSYFFRLLKGAVSRRSYGRSPPPPPDAAETSAPTGLTDFTSFVSS